MATSEPGAKTPKGFLPFLEHKVRKPLGRPQTSDELGFYARNYVIFTYVAIVFCLPIGLMALHFSMETTEANKSSDWEDAYLNSSKTIWLNICSILVSLGLIYLCVLCI